MASQTDDVRAASEPDLEAGRADTLNQADPYRLALNEEALGGLSPHFVIGSLVGAITVPEALSVEDCLEDFIERVLAATRDLDDDDAVGEDVDDDDDDDDERVFDDDDRDDEVDAYGAGLDDAVVADEESTSPVDKDAVRALYEQVSQRIADGAVASLVPIADDAAACDKWIEGLHSVVGQTLHELTEAEARVALRVFAQADGNTRVTRAERKERARTSLAADVTRLIQLWSEVSPENLDRDAVRWSEVVPKPASDELKERVIHTGGTFVRAEPKVGRNDLCPCGSGKKYKKCCG